MDWAIIIGILILIAVSVFAVMSFIRGSDTEPTSQNVVPTNTYDQAIPDLQKIIPPDSAYPAPAKEQRAFYKIYTEKEVQYSIEKLVINTSNNPALGPDTYLVKLYNTANKDITVQDSAAVTIGCSAKDKPYAHTAIPAQPLILSPYEKRDVKLAVGVNCMYLGTSDNKYFWRIY
jgi:hypothetical protein